MKPQVQSRIGSDGRCFPACLASILELPESQVPDLDNTDETQVNDFLSSHGLRYQEIPIDSDTPIPVGYHIICGVSPRGGMHAVVGRDGEFIWDPHPVEDDPRRGVVRPERWGLLTPTQAHDYVPSKKGPGIDKDICRVCGTGYNSTVHTAADLAPVEDTHPLDYRWGQKDAANLRAIISNLRATVQMIESAHPITPSRQKEADQYKVEVREWERLLAKCGVMERRGARDAKKTATGKAVTNWHLRKKCAKCGGPVSNDAKPGKTWCQACLLESVYSRRGPMDAAQKADVARVRKAIVRAYENEMGGAKDRADMIALCRNTAKQGGPFRVQLTEKGGREHTESVHALRAYDADLQPVPPYKPGQRIVLSNGKTTMVHKVALGENLLGEAEWHILTTSGDYVTVKIK